MLDLKIKLSRENFNYKFKQYEGMYFFAQINNESEVVRYKITKDDKGNELKEFGNTHIKNNYLYVPQIEVYIDINKI